MATNKKSVSHVTDRVRLVKTKPKRETKINAQNVLKVSIYAQVKSALKDVLWVLISQELDAWSVIAHVKLVMVQQISAPRAVLKANFTSFLKTNVLLDVQQEWEIRQEFALIVDSLAPSVRQHQIFVQRVLKKEEYLFFGDLNASINVHLVLKRTRQKINAKDVVLDVMSVTQQIKEFAQYAKIR